MKQWFSKNWWWLTILIIGGGVGYYYYQKGKDKPKPPGGGGGGGDSYVNIDGQTNPLLKLGTKGQKVQELQVRLQNKGQKLPSGADSYFGTETQTALKNLTGKTEILYTDVLKL